MKVLLIIITSTLLFLPLHCKSDARHVGREFTYKTLKEGIASCRPGDTLFVHAGTYKEGNIVIEKSLCIIGID